MHFVGVDPSLSNTGLVVLDARGNLVLKQDLKELQSKKWEKTTKGQMLRMEAIAHLVIDTIPGDSYVGYEDYSFDSVNMSFTTGELGGILRLHLVRVVQDLVLVAPKSLKKFGTGLGSAKKETMIAAALKECPELGPDPSDDICDAYFLAKYAWYKFAPDQAVKCETNRDQLRGRLELIKKANDKESKK